MKLLLDLKRLLDKLFHLNTMPGINHLMIEDAVLKRDLVNASTGIDGRPLKTLVPLGFYRFENRMRTALPHTPAQASSQRPHDYFNPV